MMKTLEIEWKHFDKEGDTCLRCASTGETVQEVVGQLAKECDPRGWKVLFKETKLAEKDIQDSNLVLLNGVPIEEILPRAEAGENNCRSCADLLDKPSTDCRTLEVDGESYESIPSSFVRRAACTTMQCCD